MQVNAIIITVTTIILIFTLIVIISNCSGYKDPVKDNQILAYVGDRTITIQDFLRRAEYSIRPAYCRQSNYLHKKIVLNSLIAEKMTGLEMDKKKDDLLESSNFKKFLKGRKEQAMRQVFYNDSFYDSVSLSEDEIRECYLLSGRMIEIDYPDNPKKQKEFDELGVTMKKSLVDSYKKELHPYNKFDKSTYPSEPKQRGKLLALDKLEKGLLADFAKNPHLSKFYPDEKEEERQLNRLKKIKSTRSTSNVDTSVYKIQKRADSNENIFPSVIEAVKVNTTEEEIMTALRTVYGEYSDPGVF